MEQQGYEKQERYDDHQGLVEPVVLGFVKIQFGEVGAFGPNGEP